MSVRRMLIAVSLVLTMALVGCGTTDETPTTTDAGTDAGTVDVATAPAGLEAMPTDGPGESAALAALPAALEQGKQMRESGGLGWPDLTGLEPTLNAYILAVDMGDQGTLFEVRADGIAHSLYAYQRAFDAASAVWTPLEMSSSVRKAPESDAERSAVAAVEGAMRDAFPDDPFTVAVYGYRFVYVDGGSAVLNVEIDPTGAVISVGN